MQYLLLGITLFSIFYFLFSVSKLWYADTFFAKGYNASREQDYVTAYNQLKKAILLNEKEPLYLDELSLPAAQLGLVLTEENETTSAAGLIQEAVQASDLAISISPNNVNFWKTRTRVFYTLYQLNDKYLSQAITSLEKALLLSPTDPKIGYNLAVIYNQQGETDKALQLLEHSAQMKKDYKETYLALGLIYLQNGQNEKAKTVFEHVLQDIDPNDPVAKEKLEELE